MTMSRTPDLPTDAERPAQWVVLRLYSHGDDDFIDFAEEPDASYDAPRRQRPWAILVVDDDDEVHRAVDLALSGAQILGRHLDIRHSHSAATARSHLLDGTRQIDLVLLDVVMETPNAGLDLLEEIRTLPSTRDLPVLLHTGQPGKAPENAVRKRYDISGYLTKSTVTRSVLIAALETALVDQPSG